MHIFKDSIKSNAKAPDQIGSENNFRRMEPILLPDNPKRTIMLYKLFAGECVLACSRRTIGDRHLFLLRAPPIVHSPIVLHSPVYFSG
jgi:hypothetical protein